MREERTRMDRRKLLLIEPNDKHRKQIMDYLNRDWCVQDAKSTQDAIAKLNNTTNRPAAILTRGTLPDGNGLDLCALIRDRPGGEQPFFLVYGEINISRGIHTIQISKKRLKQQWGVDIFLPNVTDPDEVVSVLRVHLRSNVTASALPEEGPKVARIESALRPEVDSREVMTWGDLLRSDLDSTTIRIILNRAFHGQRIRGGEESTSSYWDKFLRSKVNVDGLRNAIQDEVDAAAANPSTAAEGAES